MAPVLNRTPLASISFTDGNGVHIRVYYQDTAGKIRETFYDDGTGWHRRQHDIIGQGKLNTGIAATSWDSGKQIRVYYLSNESKLVERCYTGGAPGSWSDGSLTQHGFEAAPYSRIAAVPYSLKDYDARVYYQGKDNKIHEAKLVADADRWTDGNVDFAVAVPGTSISAACSKNRSGQRVWVYYQKADTKPFEYLLLSQDRWIDGAYKPAGTFAPGAGLSAIHWGDYNIRVFAINDQNKLVVTDWVKAHEWQDTKEIKTVITESDVAAVWIPNDRDWIRVYSQSGAQTVSENGSDNGAWPFATTQDSIPVEH